MALTRSGLWRSATGLIPGGVNSPVRAMRAVGLSEPVFMQRGEGSSIEDVHGHRYVDWVQSWGPLVFGHADPETLEAVQAAAEAGHLDERAAALEALTAVKRAGAGTVVTYWAKDLAGWL